MLGNVINCLNCNKIFVKVEKDICPDCHREEEKKFLQVYQFMSMKKNRESTMEEISLLFDISILIIIRWTKEGRFRHLEVPHFLYKCEKCREPIKKNRLCNSCIQEIHLFMKQEELKKEKERQFSYHTMHERNSFHKK